MFLLHMSQQRINELNEETTQKYVRNVWHHDTKRDISCQWRTISDSITREKKTFRNLMNDK